MADKKSWLMVPEEIPSPDELFHSEKKKKEGAVSASRRKPIPRYKIVKRFSIGFLIALGVIFLIMMNLDKFGIRFFYMMSSSMESVIPKGSFLIEYKADLGRLKEGDIITYMNEDGVSVTHEIVEVIQPYSDGEPAFWTKGTENRNRDEQIVTYSDIQGRVIFHIPYVGNIFISLEIS